MNYYHQRAWAEVNLLNLEHNINIINEKLIPPTQMMAVVKADAYGHGEKEVCETLVKCGVKYFAVSNLDEAINVRQYVPDGEILILGYTPPEYAKELIKYNIIQGVVSKEHAIKLSENALPEKVRCHIKIDTGMGRVGLKYINPSDCANAAEEIINLSGINAEGLYTHFAVADSDDKSDEEYTAKQEKFILSVYDILAERGIKLKHVHYLNSAGICYHNNSRSTLARAGIIIYGLCPNSAMSVPLDMKPVMSLKAVISLVKEITDGDFVSYGRTFQAHEKVKLATVTVGYADGYSRLLSSKGEALLHGKRCRIIGRVCMDQLMLDVSDVDDVKSGDIVTLIGKDENDEITADELAGIYGTIGYEIVCGISKRVPRYSVK